MPDRPKVSVHLLPSLIPPGALGGGIAIVVDVLRATTVMVHALASGIEAVIPCLEIDEARGVAEGLGPGRAILGGEREGLPIEGFDLGNSPASYTPEICRGKTLVITTTNGTRAIHASLGAERVVIGAFTNARATVDAGLSAGEEAPIHVVCSGTDGFVSFEDALLAGFLASLLDRQGVEAGNDEAEIALRTWRHSEFGTHQVDKLADALAIGRGGRRVRALGLAADLKSAALIDEFHLTAELRRDPLRIVRVV